MEAVFLEGTGAHGKELHAFAKLLKSALPRPGPCQYKTGTADYGLRTTDYGLGIKHGLGIKRGLSITDWV